MQKMSGWLGVAFVVAAMWACCFAIHAVFKMQEVTSLLHLRTTMTTTAKKTSEVDFERANPLSLS